MRSYFKLILSYLPLKLAGFTYFMGFLQFFYLYQVFVTDDVGGYNFSPFTIFTILISLVSVMWFFQLIRTLFSGTRLRLVMASIIFLNLYTGIVAYHFGAQELLDWSVIADNWGILFSPEALEVVMVSLSKDALLYGVCFTVLFLGLELWRRTLSKGIILEKDIRRRYTIGAVVVYVLFLILPFESQDPIVNFFRSISHHYKVQRLFNVDVSNISWLHNDGRNFDAFKPNGVLKNEPPHVFLIVVESLNASALEKTSPEGTHYLPFLRQLRDKSVYVDHFYGNSIQTAKGHFATFFSVIPSLTGKTFVRFDDLEIRSIGSYMKAGGYSTSIFSAYYKKGFDNTHDFLMARGFDRFDVVRPYVTDEERKDRLRWGVEDSVYFRHFFDYLEERLDADNGAPQFIVLPTIANHFPFNSLKDHQKELYKPADGFLQDYANSVRLCDNGIRTFFQELEARGLAENSIVIVTGDHAFPMGEHHNFHLEAGYHEESFRIPFFLVWKGQLQPQKIQRAYSQMDIGPTLLDLVGIDPGKNTLQGDSIFSKEKRNPIYLVQPYGKHLAIVNYPFKYRLHTKTMAEYVYHLEDDPMETRNIISDISSKELAYYRLHIQRMFQNQKAIKENLFKK